MQNKTDPNRPGDPKRCSREVKMPKEGIGKWKSQKKIKIINSPNLL